MTIGIEYLLGDPAALIPVAMLLIPVAMIAVLLCARGLSLLCDWCSRQ